MEAVRVLSVCEWMNALNEQKAAAIPGVKAIKEQLDAELNQQHRGAEPDATWEHVIKRVATFYVEHRATLLDALLFMNNQLALAPQLCFAGIDAEGQIVGFIMGHFSDNSRRTVWVGNFFVRREHRGCGLGARIWERFWCAIQKLEPHVTAVGLSVAVGSPIAPFYERQGFRRVHCWCRLRPTHETEEVGLVSALEIGECDPANSNICPWDRFEWTGRVDTLVVEVELQKLTSSGAFCITDVPTLTDELVALDREITGHDRSHFVRTLSAKGHILVAHKTQPLASNSFCQNKELHESSGARVRLVGYSVLLELESAFYVLSVVANEPETTGLALLLSQLQFTTRTSQNSQSLSSSPSNPNNLKSTSLSSGAERSPKPVVMHTQRFHMPLLEPLLRSLGITPSLEVRPHLLVEIAEAQVRERSQNATKLEDYPAYKVLSDGKSLRQAVLERMIGGVNPLQEVLVVSGGRFMI